VKAVETELIAIDVALVPPEPVLERARRINAALKDGGLQFDSTHLPHLTLVQLFIRRANLPALAARLDPICGVTAPLPIRVRGFASEGATVSFQVDRTAELVQLHESLMDTLREWEEPEGGAGVFFSDGEPPREMDVAYVTNFRAQASYAKFIPHITLGFGIAPRPGRPFEFLADRIGLFHLGRFCACRMLLHQWTVPHA